MLQALKNWWNNFTFTPQTDHGLNFEETPLAPIAPPASTLIMPTPKKVVKKTAKVVAKPTPAKKTAQKAPVKVTKAIKKPVAKAAKKTK